MTPERPVVVAGVGQLYQGDLDLGRVAAERLSGEDLGPHVVVEDFYYGAVAVAQRLDDLRPRALVLVGAVAAGDAPGTVRIRKVETREAVEPTRAQASVADAITGYVGIDIVTEVAGALGSLPDATTAIEIEPGSVGSGDGLSVEGKAGLERALGLVRSEVAGLVRSPVTPT